MRMLTCPIRTTPIAIETGQAVRRRSGCWPSPGPIRMGEVVRATETDLRLVGCFDASTNACTLTPSCRLKHLFDDALKGYFKALDGATLADMTHGLALPKAAISPSPAVRKLPAVVAAKVSTKAATATPRRPARPGRGT